VVSAHGVKASALLRKAVAWGSSRVLARHGGHLAMESSVAFVSPSRIRSLNGRYRGKDRVTDVLSFPLGEDVEGRRHAGDVVICLARARSQAKREGHSLVRELELLAVHGTLHLLGYEHKDRPGDRMRRLESALLRRGKAKGR